MKRENLEIPTEEEEQAILFQWAELNRATMPELALLYHIPNGGLRSKTEAARFKAAGVKSGVPDICLPIARGEYHGLYIELKRLKGGVVSENQNWWIACLREQGYQVEVCCGWMAAAELIGKYLREGELPW